MFSLFKSRKKESNALLGKLPYSTDIHSHLLPGIDDGAKTVEDSLDLVRAMKSWGITQIIATPHITQEVFENDKASIAEAYETLQRALKENELADSIQICYAAEHRLDGLFLDMMEKEQILLLPNNYVLIENSFMQPFWDLKGVVFQLRVKGFTPILAHPERYPYYSVNNLIFEELHQMGCLLQVNILSLAGHYGKEVKERAMALLKNNLIDLLGTDLHHVGHVEAITAFLQSKEYAKLAPRLQIKNDTLFVAP